jgi:LysM domain
MLKRMLAVVAGVLLVASGFAAEPELRDDHPQTYTVVRGDTLWDISARFLRSPWLWPEIWQANSQIENPHLIYPGDVISLVYVDGQPRLMRGGRPDVVKLSPRVRSSGPRDAITAIPLNSVRPFLEKMRVLTEADAKDLPYVVSAEESRLLSVPGQVVYVRGLDARPGDEVDVVRPTVIYRDVPKRFRWGNSEREFEKIPFKGVKQKTLALLWEDWSRDLFRKSQVDTLGHEFMHVARARVLRTGDPSTLVLQSSEYEVIDGDLILPVDASPYDATYFPHSPGTVPDNMRVLAVSDTEVYTGPMRVVAMSRGAREGVENGQVYSVFQPGERLRDNVKYAGDDLRTTITDRKAMVTMPEEFLGHVMVFRTFEKVSYGLVMDGIRPIKVHDVIRVPQSL